MEKKVVVQIHSIFLKLGPLLQILVSYGGYQQAYLLMPRLWKRMNRYWTRHLKAILNAFSAHRQQLHYPVFSPGDFNDLNRRDQLRCYSFRITVEDRGSIHALSRCLAQVQITKDLLIRSILIYTMNEYTSNDISQLYRRLNALGIPLSVVKIESDCIRDLGIGRRLSWWSELSKISDISYFTRVGRVTIKDSEDNTIQKLSELIPHVKTLYFHLMAPYHKSTIRKIIEGCGSWKRDVEELEYRITGAYTIHESSWDEFTK